MFLLFFFVLGMSVGSFLNVFVARYGQDIPAWRRSHCLICHRQLLKRDLIPLLSFFLLHGRCRFCKQSLSWQYPLMEFITGLLFVVVYWKYQESLGLGQGMIESMAFRRLIFSLLKDLVFVSYLVLLFVFDLRYLVLPDVILLPGIVIIFALNLIFGANPFFLLCSAVLLSGFFLLQFVVSQGKWIGGGDIRLGFLIGSMLGWPWALYALWLSYLLGGLAAVFLLISGLKKRGDLLPYGVFLTTAAFVYLVWGQNFFLNFSG